MPRSVLVAASCILLLWAAWASAGSPPAGRLAERIDTAWTDSLRRLASTPMPYGMTPAETEAHFQGVVMAQANAERLVLIHVAAAAYDATRPSSQTDPCDCNAIPAKIFLLVLENVLAKMRPDIKAIDVMLPKLQRQSIRAMLLELRGDLKRIEDCAVGLQNALNASENRS